MAGGTLLVTALAVLHALLFSQSQAVRAGDPEDSADENTRLLDRPEHRPLVTVKAYWMRHGISCANVLKMQADAFGISWDKAHGLTFGLYKDPPLTDCAIARAKLYGPVILEKIQSQITDELFEKPLVFSSELTRAMETALYNFPDSAVYPIPHIAEHGLSRDNRPLATVDEQRKQIEMPSAVKRKPTGAELVDQIFFVEGVNSEEDRAGSGWGKSNYEYFLTEFPDILTKLLTGRAKDNDTIPVVIVGHSGFMRDELKCDFRTYEEFEAKKAKHKPKNNEVWIQEYTTYLPDRDQLLSGVTKAHSATMKAGRCTPLLPREVFPDPPELMCEKDVGRCSRDRFPDGLVERDEEQCQGLSLCAGEIE